MTGRSTSSRPPRTRLDRRGWLTASWLLAAACGGTVEDHTPLAVPDQELCEGPTCLCSAGRGDCDGDPATGCEADLSSSSSHCGSCGQGCDHGSCAQGRCVCNDGFADCDGSATTSCETDLRIDGQHCGACGHSCGGGPCVAGQCQPEAIATDLASPVFVAVGSERAFWTEWDLSPQGISWALKDGSGAPVSLLPEPYPTDLTMDGSTLYWLTEQGVWRLDQAAEPSPQLVAASPAARGLRIGPSRAFWLTLSGDLAAVPKHGQDAPVDTLAVNVDNIASTDAFLYWLAQGAISRMELATGTVALIASEVPYCYSLTAAGTDLYCGTQSQLLAMSDPGVPPMPLVSFSDGDCPYEILVDDSALYWLGSWGKIMRLARAGGAPMTLTDAQVGGSAYGLAQDSEWLYWGTSTQIMRLFK